MSLRNIVIEELKTSEVYRQRVEVVERKGLGHPDYICDSIMDQVSVNLCREYQNTFGDILHHNIDKGLLVAGEVEGKFGGGRVISPMRLIFGDRATFEAGGVEIDINGIAVNTAREWLTENLRFVDPENLLYQVELKKGSAELTDLFNRTEGILGANDTSAAVGYAPMSPTERLVLECERHLNSRKFKKEYPESGEDIKVMGLRQNSEVHLTVAMALVDRFVESEGEYFRQKAEIKDQIEEFAATYAESENAEAKNTKNEKPLKTSASLNTLDMRGRGMDGVYTTVTGTSAEDADCGQVGRGNRVNGIIPLNRPVSSEAAAGKNPVSHIGKIYNVLSHRIADRIYRQVPEIAEVYVWLLSEIGTPIDRPQIATAQLIMKNGAARDVEAEATEAMEKELENIREFCMELAAGKIPIC